MFNAMATFAFGRGGVLGWKGYLLSCGVSRQNLGFTYGSSLSAETVLHRYHAPQIVSILANAARTSNPR